MNKKRLYLFTCIILIGLFLAGCYASLHFSLEKNGNTKIVDKPVTIDYNATPEQILLAYTEEGMGEFKRNFQDKPTMDFALKSIGKQAPDFELTNISGNTIKLSELKGKKVVLDIIKSDCPECMKATPVVSKVKSEMSDIIIIPVFPRNTKAEVEEFYKNLNLEVDMLSIAGKDNAEKMTLIKDYKLTQVPTMIFIDESGKISYIHIGSSDEVVLRDYMSKAFGTNKLYDFVRKDKVMVDKNGNPVVDKTTEQKDTQNNDNTNK